MSQEERQDWIMDLYNHGGYEVYTKNVGDDDDCLDWLCITMGIVACYITNQIVIRNFRLSPKSFNPIKSKLNVNGQTCVSYGHA